MRYYIPTTILNIGNILSSDSISPESFYKIRGFGNPHWYSVEENNLPNVILLYKDPFKFLRPKSEIEDRPMLISVECSEGLIPVNDGLVTCDHTIYFDWNTEFVFFSQEDKIAALSLANIGVTTKMTMLYREKRMKVNDALPITKHNLNNIQKFFDTNSDILRIEYRRNKIQGLLYGYYVGALLTTTPQNVGSLGSLKEAYDVLVSGFASYLGKSQKKEVLEVMNIAKECIAKKIKGVEMTIAQSHRALPVSSNEIAVEGERILFISNNNIQEREKRLFIDWVNDVLIMDNWGKHVNSIKSELADELTDEAIKVLGNEWGASYIRTFLNDLRHHLAGEAFHQEWNNGLLSSLAAFLINGDDWEDLLRFMQRNGMYDYRLAFALWGTFMGFADMPRTFTDYLFKQERKYIGEFYDFVYNQIHGKPILRVDTSAQPTPIKSLRNKVEVIWENMPSDFKGKKDKDICKNKKIVEDVLNTIEPSQNIDHFLQILCKQDGWKKGNRINYFRKHLTSILFIE